jgi:hypothetical protein
MELVVVNDLVMFNDPAYEEEPAPETVRLPKMVVLPVEAMVTSLVPKPFKMLNDSDDTPASPPTEIENLPWLLAVTPLPMKSIEEEPVEEVGMIVSLAEAEARVKMEDPVWTVVPMISLLEASKRKVWEPEVTPAALKKVTS